MKSQNVLLIFMSMLFILSGCKREPYGQPKDALSTRGERGELDFYAKNITGKQKFVTCFYYTKKSTATRWNWYKSPVYELDNTQLSVIDIDTISRKEDMKDTIAILAVFDDKTEADTSTVELTPDENKIYLDRLTGLKNKVVDIETREYGERGKLLEFSIRDKREGEEAVEELDFYVENKTGEDLLVTAFAYAKDDESQEQFEFEKTEVQDFPNKKSVLIDLSTISDKYNRSGVQAYIALFKTDEEKEAQDSTYELLDENKKVLLGNLSKIVDANMLVVVRKKKYGLEIDKQLKSQESFYEIELVKLS